MMKQLSQHLLDLSDSSVQALIEHGHSLQSKILRIEEKCSTISKKELPQTHQELKKILTTPHSWLKKESEILKAQKEQISMMRQFFETYSQPIGKKPRELQRKIKKLKQFQRRSEQWPLQFDILKEWTNNLIENQKKNLNQMVRSYRTHLSINIFQVKVYRDLLYPEVCRQFARTVYRRLLTYDVPTSSYILEDITSLQNLNQIINAKKKIIIFRAEQSEKEIECIFNGLEKTRQIIAMIKEELKGEEQLKVAFEEEASKQEECLKAQVQYILPHLSLANRKKLILNFNEISLSEVSLFDILVRFRVKGQDGEILSASIEALKTKILQNTDEIKSVLTFLEICEGEDKSQQIAFFIAEELINSLEGTIPEDKFDHLIALRQSIRFKIHHPS